MRIRPRRLILLVLGVGMLSLLYFLKWTPKGSVNKYYYRSAAPRQSPRPVKTEGTCSWNNCNPVKEGMLNVHIIAHTHDDVGWVKTMDQYYTGDGGGSGESVQMSGECVRCLMDHAIPLLLDQPSRRFIYAEMTFFSRWFSEQTEDMKNKVRTLVNERRLELIDGGWCVSDAAATYYNDVIDQHTLGFDFINKTFGECGQPRVGWHIDQFGHSREHSSLFAQMGFDGIFMGRMDIQDLVHRKRTKNMDLLWRSSPNNLGDKAALFGSILHDGYFPPHGLGMEGYPPGMIQDHGSESYIQAITSVGEEWAKSVRTNHVLVPFGGDFAFNTASGWFSNLDKLISIVNAKQANGGRINLLYSTPACYMYYVNQAGVKLEAKEDDFLPYSITPGVYWTGYFTSRAGLKRHIKVASSLLQTCKTMVVLSRLQNFYSKVVVLKKAVAVLQHHDAITGTEKQHVTNDYNKMLSSGETECRVVIDAAYKTFFNDPNAPEQIFCPDLNVSRCVVTEANLKFQINLFNSLGREVFEYLRLPVAGNSYSVTDAKGEVVPSQLVELSMMTLVIPERGQSVASAELVIKAQVPPLGLASFAVTGNTVAGENALHKIEVANEADITISNEFLKVTVDPSTGKLSQLQNKKTGSSISFDHDFRYYIGFYGVPRSPNDRTMVGEHRRASGAYAFIPKDSSPPTRVFDGKVQVKTVKGDLVQELHQDFGPWVKQVVRLYAGAQYLEMEWTVGPIPWDNQTREVVSLFSTDIASGGQFYTDSHGREMILRKRNHRMTYALNVTDPISGNYYPVTSKIFIRDVNRDMQLTVLTDRCQGGSSLFDGQIELMVHRRTVRDDDLGVGEPLNERGVDGKGLILRGRHYVLLGTVMESLEHRPLALQINQPPTVSFMLTDEGTWHQEISGLRKMLPKNVHVLTLDQQSTWGENTYLLRLENFYEKGELPEDSVSLTLKRLFTAFDILQLEELNLGATAFITDTKRLQWSTTDGTKTPEYIGSEDARDIHQEPFYITLKPMEIRTFRMVVGPPTPESWLSIFS